MASCETCKKFLLDSEIAGHQCPPRFECIDLQELEDFAVYAEEGGEEPEDFEWVPVYGRDPVEAAEKFARKRLEETGEIRVRVRNAHGVFLDLRVTAEYELSFDASADGDFNDPTRWERDRLANSWDFYKRTQPVDIATA